MAKGDKLDISTIKKYLASGTFAARFVTNKDINNEHGEGVSTLMNILVDESLSFMPFIKLPVFPANEDAREDIFYIIDDELYIFEAPDTWIQLVGGGGSGEKSHQFVEALPTNPKNNVEYIVMKDIADCSSFTGSFVWNSNANCWVNTSGAGQGVNDKYTFEKTSTGWIAKKNGTTIFTYSDQRIIQNQVDIKDIQNDIYGDYLVNRIEVCPNTPLVLTVDDTDPKKKKIKLCLSGDLGDKSDGAYEIKGQLSTFLSTALLGTTPVHASNVPDLDTNNIVIGETYLYDHQGTLAVVVDYDQSTDILTATTMTTSPGERSGVRLGAVEEQTDLPTTLVAATALGWLTPVEGDFAYVRKDGPNSDKLAEYLIQSIDNSGNITWAFSHYINAGNYVVDINLSDGTLIPKNPDGTVTLPNYVKKVELDDGTILSVDAQGKVTLPDFCELKGVRTSDGTLLTIAADKTVTLPEIPEKFNTYKIETTLEEWLDAKTDVDTLQDIDPAKLVDIIKKGSSMTISDFSLDVTPNRDLIYVHGKDRNSNTTQEAIAWFVSYSATTGIKLRILAIPGQGNSSSNGDKEVPEYTRNLYAGDKINHLELITYDNVLYRMIDTSSYTLTGNWVIDKTHFEVINSEAKNTYYNLTNDGQMLASWTGSYAEQAPQPLSQSVNAKVVEYSHGGPADVISFNPTTSVWTFRGGDKGRRFEILANLATLGRSAHADAATNGVQVYADWNIAGTTTPVTPAFGQFNNPKEAIGYGGGSGSAFQFDVPAGTEIKIQSALTAYTSDSGKKVWVRSGASNITIKEIGRVVDPVAYLLNDGDAQEMPVGSLIQIMSNSAPKHYLVCDGSAYTIGTYPELEAHFLKEFGSVTHFGAGAAANTYKVPDLRGEFLRMTGTNGHTNAGTGKAEGSGAAVGVHQPATLTQNNAFVGKPSTAGTVAPTLIDYLAVNPDSSSASNGTAPACQGYVNLNGRRYNSDYGTILTSRPTNTSVNVAIKCESTPRVIVDQGTYKVSVPFTITADNSTVTFDVANAEDDTTMVKNSTTLVAPVTGYYAIGTQVNGAGNWLQQMALYITRSNLGVWQSGVGVTGVFKLQAGDEVEFNVSKVDSKPKSGYLNMALVNTVADHKVAEMMQKPNLWTPGVEQSFGDGVYGYRIQIASLTTTPATGSRKATALLKVLPASLKAKHVLDWGGTYLNSNDYFWSIPGSYTGGEHILYISNHTGVPNGNDEWSITITETTPGTMRNFDIWVLYTK